MNSLCILRILRILRPVPIPIPVPRPFLAASTSARPFSSSTVFRHGERFGDAQTGKDDPDFKVEKLKQQSVEQQKKGQGAWVPGLASDSEENIKADKSGFDVNKVKDEQKK